MKNNIEQALKALSANKFRTFLSMLGVAVGAGAVVGLLYSGMLASENSLKQIRSMGSRFVSLNLVGSETNGFLSADLAKILHRHDRIQTIVPMQNTAESILVAGHKLSTTLFATSPGFAEIIKLKLARGRFVHNADSPATTCVVGAKLAAKIAKFGVLNSVNKNIYINGSACLVVGELASMPANFFLPMDINDAVITGISPHSLDIKNLLVQFKTEADVISQSGYVIADLRAQVPGGHFFERTPNFLLDHIKSEQRNRQLLLAVIAGISLIVGGIGIMNIMLVSVAERRLEIGLRLAVGATKQDILYLFVAEASLISIIGGCIGVLFALILSYVMTLFSDWTFQVFYWPVLLGLGVSSLLGVFFGYYPASKAAALDPIVCIRG